MKESQLDVDDDGDTDADTDVVEVVVVHVDVVDGHRWQHQISQLRSVQAEVTGAHGIGVEGRSGQHSSLTESLESESESLPPVSMAGYELRSSSSMPLIRVGGVMEGGI